MHRQQLKISSMCFVLSCLSLFLFTSQAEAAKKGEQVGYLFVQTTDAGSFDGKTLVLKGVSPQTVFFSDRPQRLAGHLKTSQFISDWSKGKNSLKKNPPNAKKKVCGTFFFLHCRNYYSTSYYYNY